MQSPSETNETAAEKPLFTIRNRWTDAVLFEGRFDTMRLCVEAAMKADANLAGAYLARANLAGANLAGAYLAGAYLAGANLAGASLADANLAGANLARADLADASLARAYLAGANLAGASLADANLAGANLARADLADASLARAYLAGANLAGAYLARANLAGAKWSDGIVLQRRGLAKDCSRSDGYQFLLLDSNQGWRVQAGCRFFTLPEAWRHWETTRANTPLGDETFDILVMFEHHAERTDAQVSA
jgi:hypothetical protein